jgi:hypothetical protein
MGLGAKAPITRYLLLLLVSIVAALASSSLAWDTPGDGTSYEMYELDDISGGAIVQTGNTYSIHETINISSGDSLLIPSGLELTFAEDAGLGVFGAVEVRGTSTMPVTMSAMVTEWSGISLHPYSSATVEYLSISKANTVLYLENVSDARIQNLVFTNVMTGIDAVGCNNTTFMDIQGTNVVGTGVSFSGCTDILLERCDLDMVTRGVFCWRNSVRVVVRNLEVGECLGNVIDFYNSNNCSIVDVSADMGSAYFHTAINVSCRDLSLSSRDRVLGIYYSSGTMTGLRIGRGYAIMMDSEFIMSNVHFEETPGRGYRFRISRSVTTIEDLKLPGQDEGLSIRYHADVTLFNSSVLNSTTTDIRMYSNSSLHLVNVSFESYVLEDEYERLKVSQVLVVNVVDEWNRPLGSVDVIVRGIDDAFEIEHTTGIDGRATFTPFSILEVTGSTSEGISGHMEVNATIGHIYNVTVVPVNRSNELVLSLFDREPPEFDPDWSLDRVRVETLEIVIECTRTPWSDNDPRFPEDANFTYLFTKGGVEVTAYGDLVGVTLPTGGEWLVTYKAIDPSGNEAEHHFSLRVDWYPQDVVPPTADAGPDQVVTYGDTYDLNGTFIQGDLTVDSTMWMIVGNPDPKWAGSNHTHTAAVVGEIEYIFRVQDWMGNPAFDTMVVKTIPRRPSLEMITILGEELTADTLIEGTASGDVPLERVEFRLDEGEWFLTNGTSNWSFTLTVDGMSEGIHTLEIRAWDGYDHGEINPVTFVYIETQDNDEDGDDGSSLQLFIVVGLVVALAAVVVAGLVVRRTR